MAQQQTGRAVHRDEMEVRLGPVRLAPVAQHELHDARANGETEQRLYGLEAWRETPYYSARERAALEWTEALTLVSDTRAPDDVYERVRAEFSESEMVHLSLAIVAINGWNRLNVAARTVPGGYVAGSLAAVHAAP
jgi:alkylhydroperoxidase family enzyme